MIRISEDLFVGRGNKRIVYQHPDNPARCLKIINPDNTPARVRRRRGGIRRWWPVRYFDDN
ncbi:MAG: hypothetical protein GWO24_09590, partial [Akkermansiaceae bacterium]|nr:hypothetical protein [Akkermansiaceae bacterium]